MYFRTIQVKVQYWVNQWLKSIHSFFYTVSRRINFIILWYLKFEPDYKTTIVHLFHILHGLGVTILRHLSFILTLYIFAFCNSCRKLINPTIVKNDLFEEYYVFTLPSKSVRSYPPFWDILFKHNRDVISYIRWLLWFLLIELEIFNV